MSISISIIETIGRSSAAIKTYRQRQHDSFAAHDAYNLQQGIVSAYGLCVTTQNTLGMFDR